MNLPLPLLTAAGIGLVAGLFIGLAVNGKNSANNPSPTAQASQKSPSSGPELTTQNRSSATSQIAPRGDSSNTRPIGLNELRLQIEDLSFFGGTENWRKWADLVDRLKVSDIAGLTSQMLSNNQDAANMEGLFVLFGVFAEKDPAGALQAAQQLPAGQLRQSAIHSVITAVAGQDPDRALAMIQALEDKSQQAQLRSMVAMVLASKDPPRALELALRTKGNNEMDFSISSIFHQWARRDLAAAKAAARELTGKDAEQAQSAILNRMAQTDPQQAWEFALSLESPGGSTRQSAYFSVLTAWVQTDPKAALKAWQQLPNSETKSQAFNSLIQNWSHTDFDGALQAVLELPETNTRSDALMSLSYGRLGEPEKVFQAILEHMPMGDNFSNAIRNVFSRWAERDPAAAALSLKELPPGQAYENGVRSVARSWAESGSYQDALQWAKSLENEQARSTALGQVISIWGEKDSSKAVSAVMNLSATERERVAPDLARAWAMRDPSAAVAWAQSFSEPKERQRILRQAVGQWAQSAPLAAAQFAVQQPPEQRAELVEQIMQNWSSRDAESAAAWLAQQPSGAWRDRATSVLAKSIAREDGAAGMQWANTITDEKRRLRELSRLYRDWQKHDPAAARQWITQANLTPEQKKQLQP